MSMSTKAEMIRELAKDPELMELARRAIEDELVEWRDNMRFSLRNNGLSIRNRDGSESGIIRFGPEMGMRIGLEAIADKLERK